MSRLEAVLKLLLVWVAVSFPFVALGGALCGTRGWLSGGLFSTAILLTLSATANRLISRICRADSDLPPGLRETYSRAAAGIGMTSKTSDLPGLLVTEDPLPRAMTSMSLTGTTSILISKGTLAALTESELRSVLQAALLKICRKGSYALRFQTLLAVICGLLFRKLPRQWPGRFMARHRMTTPSPLAFLFMLTVYPLIRFLTRSSQGSTPFNPELERALRKLERNPAFDTGGLPAEIECRLDWTLRFCQL